MSYYLAQWWDKVVNAIRVVITNPISQNYVTETIAVVTNADADPADDFDYYVDMSGFRKGYFHFVLSGGAALNTMTITCEGSIQDDGTAPSDVARDWVDITNDTFGVPSLTCNGNIAVTDIWADNTEMLSGYKYLRIRVAADATAGTNLTQDWTIYHKRLY